MNLRRLRLNRHLRELSREVYLDVRQLVQPLFVVEGLDKPQPLAGLSGNFNHTASTLARQVEADLNAGVSKFLLFVVPAHKRNTNFDWSFACEQIAALKQRFGTELWLSVDVCLCSTTEHGHCGLLDATGTLVLDDSTSKVLAQQALAFAQAGADCVAPSDMMDGRVGCIRQALDEGGCEATLLLSYSTKYASQFYGPFRLACQSSPTAAAALRDRTTYQLDFRRKAEGLACALRDWHAGADVVMVKPAVHYLDVICQLKAELPIPIAAYYVSGEHAMVEAAAERGWLEGPAAHLETLFALRRAGADILITYAAREVGSWLTS